MTKTIVIQYIDYNIELYSISSKFTFNFQDDNLHDLTISELDKQNVKHLNAIQYAFSLKGTQKCNLSISDIVIKSNNQLMNQHYNYSCYYSLSNKNLDFSAPKYLIFGNILEKIQTNDIFFVTLFIQNNYKFVNMIISNSVAEYSNSFKEELGKTQQEAKRKADNTLNLQNKKRVFNTENFVNLIDDVRHECGYILRGYKTKNNPFYFETYFKEYFTTRDKNILKQYSELGFVNVFDFIKNCPIKYNFNTTGVKSPVKGIRQSVNNEYESATYFPQGIYEIYKKDIHFCCKVTEWSEIDTEKIVKDLNHILDTNNKYTIIDGITFEGIPCLVPYFRNNERKITWGMIIKIDKIKCKDETQYIVTCNYVDDNIHYLKIFLQDIIISKDIPFGMHYDTNNRLVYKFYDDLKRDKKILLPNLTIKL